MRTANIHATGLVVGTLGLMIVGPSGSGKSALAYACLLAAKRDGLLAALVGDDRLDITEHPGGAIMRGPSSIAGLLEIRASGILRVNTIPAAPVTLVLTPADPGYDERLPPENEVFDLPTGSRLPLIRVPKNLADPLLFVFDIAKQRSEICL